MSDNQKQDHGGLGQLQQMVEAMRCDVPDAAQWQGAHGRLMDRLSVIDGDAEERPTPVRRLARPTAVRWAASLAAVATVLFVVSVLVFWSGESRLAFAAVLANIQSFRPHSYTETLQYEGEAPTTTRVMRLSLARRREIWPDGHVFVVDLSQSPNRTLMLQPETKQSIETVIRNSPSRQDPNLLESLTRMRAQDAERLGQRRFGSCDAEGFHLRGAEEDWTVWADAKTELPIRIELVQKDLKRKFVWDDFDFGVQFDESLFSTKAPEGYAVVQEEEDVSTPTEQDLLAGLRAAAEILGGRFPDSFDWQALGEAVRDQRKTELPLTNEETQSLNEKLRRAIRYTQILTMFEKATDVRYLGKGVKLGDAKSAVFCWRANASDRYRVIFGDLSVKELRPDELPQTGAPHQNY